mgnify:FL=1
MEMQYRKILFLGVLAACAGSFLYYKRNIRMPLKTYTRRALQMAVLDDAICRRELEGNSMGGHTITFPPETETLPHRDHLFLSMNRKKSRIALQAELARMEQRLREAEGLRNTLKTNLDIGFAPYESTEEPSEEP